MLKVMLADDEAIIRDGMRKAIPWDDLELEFVGAAADGREALQLAVESKPDIIITDIAMPYLNGLEFIEELRKHYEDNYIIIVSGYDEFDYAKQCIKLGVVEYVLKPIDLDALIKILNNIKEDYEEKKKSKQEVEELKKTLEDSCNAARDNILLKLLLYPSEFHNDEELKKLNLDSDQYGVCAVLTLIEFDILKTNFHSMNGSQYFEEFENLVRESMEEENIKIYCNQEAGQVTILILNKNEKILENQIRYSLYKIRAALRKEGIFEYHCCVGRVYRGLLEIGKSYRDVLEMIDYAFVMPGNKDLYYEEYESMKGIPVNDIVGNIAQAMGTLRTFDKNIIRKTMDNVSQMIRTAGVDSFTVTQIAVSTIYGEVIKVLGELGYSIDCIVGNSVEGYKKILKCGNLDETMKELYLFLCNICDYIEMNKKEGIYNPIIERAKMYIKNNYSNPALSLDEIAGTLNISPGYLSILFKQVSGESFINYLTAIRMEKAKGLLIYSNLKTYEISYKVGYDNPTYFSTTFKKNVGVKPKEFREAQINPAGTVLQSDRKS